jgi:hypothetical protein
MHRQGEALCRPLTAANECFMARRPVNDPGFDVEAAYGSLVGEVMRLGGLSEADLETLMASWRRPVDIEATVAALIADGVPAEAIRERSERWSELIKQRALIPTPHVRFVVTRELAHDAVQLHGLPGVVNGVATPVCATWPCRVHSVWAAILELAIYRDEVESERQGLIAQIDELEHEAEKFARDARALARRLGLQRGREQQLQKEPHGSTKALDGCLRVLQAAIAGVEDVSGAMEPIRSYALSLELRYATPNKRGRRKQWLLTAVTQHLAHGGLGADEIAQLVPDGSPAHVSQLAERVRKRVSGENCRTFSLLPPPSVTLGNK